MSLRDAIKRLDFREPGQRLIASATCIGLGAMANGLDATNTPAGVLAGVLANIGVNVLSSDFHSAVTRRLGRAKEIFRNHDLTQLVGKTIGLVIERTADNPKLTEDRGTLKSLAKAAPAYWDTLAPLTATDESLTSLSEAELTRFVAVSAEEFESLTALDTRTWENFVRALAEAKGVTLRSAAFPRVASELHLTFPVAFRELLKQDFATDGRAFAGLQMLVWGETLGALQDLRLDIANRGDEASRAYREILDFVDQGLKRLSTEFRDFASREDLDKIVSLNRSLLQNVRDGFTENRALHGVTHEKLDQLTALFEVSQEPSPVSGLSLTMAATTSPPSSAARLPPRNPRFLPREDERGDDILVVLHARPRSAHRIVLHGMPGVGKTQAALEYAHRHSEDRSTYKQVYWTVADTEDQFVIGLSGIAQRLGLPADQPPTEILGAIHTRLEAADDWLWIVDGAYNPFEIARRYLPKPQSGRVLITTTRPVAELRGVGGLTVELTRFFDPIAGAKFLSALLREDGSIDDLSHVDREAAISISEEVSGLPLALDQAAAYIEHTGGTPAEYLAEYRRRGPVLRDTRTPLGDEDDRDHPTVTRTFSMLFQWVDRENPESADLLRLCAFLAADSIPDEILSIGSPDLGDRLGPAVERSLSMTRMPALRARLLEVNADAKTIRIHRLLQDVLRDLMNANDRSVWAERAIRAVNRAIPEVTRHEPEVINRFLSHLEVCAQHVTRNDMKFVEAGRLLDKLGCFLHYRARYAESQHYLSKGLAITEAAAGQDHPDTARSLNNLAILLDVQGGYAEAEPLYRRALGIRESRLGSEHPDTATSLDNLAVQFQSQGRYAEAEPLHRRALEIRESRLGEEHPLTATGLDNLAGLLKAQGRYAEAEPLYRRALEIREEKLGHDHPDTANSLNNLAGLLEVQGGYAEAEPLYRRALGIRESRLGSEHPDTAKCLSNLAGLLQAQKRYLEAEEKSLRAIKIMESQLGSDHPHTATSLNNLATLLQSQGKYREAEGLFQRTLHICESRLGPNHPSTANSLNNLAGLLQSQGNYVDAEPLLRRSLVINESRLGPDHPDTANSFNNLAWLLQSQGNYVDAEPLALRAWKMLERSLGINAPKSRDALQNCLFLLKRNGRNTEYRSILSRIEPKWAQIVKDNVDATLRADRGRRGL